MVNIKLKWNKLTLDCNVGQSTETFKSNIFQLTGVPVDRQKLMAKGAWIGVYFLFNHKLVYLLIHHLIGTLKDGDSQALIKLKDVNFS
jgi:hypothetical protein